MADPAIAAGSVEVQLQDAANLDRIFDAIRADVGKPQPLPGALGHPIEPGP